MLLLMEISLKNCLEQKTVVKKERKKGALISIRDKNKSINSNNNKNKVYDIRRAAERVKGAYIPTESGSVLELHAAKQVGHDNAQDGGTSLLLRALHCLTLPPI